MSPKPKTAQPTTVTRQPVNANPVTDTPLRPFRAPGGAAYGDTTIGLTLDQMEQQFGDSGTARWGGFFNEEPSPQFRSLLRIDTIEEMRRTDGAIKAVLNAIKSPILATEWRVEGNDPEIQKFVEDQLFNMQRSWTDFLREALAYLDFGFYVFEKIYGVKDSRIVLKDLAPRIPRSIYRWRLDDGTFGVQQLIRTDEYFDNNGMKTTKAQIPGEKLVILTNEKEGDDLTGQPILRPAYKHWYYKDLLYKIQGIAAERYGVGIPVVTLPETFGDAEKTKADEMGRNIRSNEEAFITLPSKEWQVSILTPQGNPHGNTIETAIDHHNRMIMIATLANFLDLGSGATGSFALSKDQSGFFLKHVDQVAVYLEQQITKQVIEPLVKVNFGDDADVPCLKHNQLGDVDLTALSTTLKTLAEGGFVEIDPSLQQWVHKMFKLPEITDDQVAAMESEKLMKQMDSMDAGMTLPDEEPDLTDTGEGEEDEPAPPPAADPNAPPQQ